jgi:hypothetical protein
MAYLGTPIDTQNQFQSLQGKRFSGDASTTAFTLDVAPSSTLDIEVFVENVRQDPNSAYSLSGTTLTFAAAPPSGTNNIYVVHQAKAVGTINPPDASVNSDKLTGNLVTPGTLDVNGQELILDADADTSITADTDDQIDFKVGGSDKFTMTTDTFTARNNVHLISASGTSDLRIQNSTTGSGSTDGLLIQATGSDVYINQYESAPMYFRTANTDRVVIDASGHLVVGKTSASIDNTGCYFDPNGISHFSANNSDVLYLNRKGADGTIVGFYQDGTNEGYIVVSGSTVSYSGFTGTHWSRLADNSKPTILRGTIMESLDEMCDWYGLNYVDDKVNKYHYVGLLPDGKNVGDSHTVTIDGTDFTGTLVKEDDIKHTKAKVSDTEASKLVYGLFVTWDNDDDTVNDMLVAQTGSYVIRIHKDETVSKGDLIQSKGDGTGKVQADDIIRASTVAKVLSTTKIETYSDGSYIVPCSLHC